MRVLIAGVFQVGWKSITCKGVFTKIEMGEFMKYTFLKVIPFGN